MCVLVVGCPLPLGVGRAPVSPQRAGERGQQLWPRAPRRPSSPKNGLLECNVHLAVVAQEGRDFDAVAVTLHVTQDQLLPQSSIRSRSSGTVSPSGAVGEDRRHTEVPTHLVSRYEQWVSTWRHPGLVSGDWFPCRASDRHAPRVREKGGAGPGPPLLRWAPARGLDVQRGLLAREEPEHGSGHGLHVDLPRRGGLRLSPPAPALPPARGVPAPPGGGGGGEGSRVKEEAAAGDHSH